MLTSVTQSLTESQLSFQPQNTRVPSIAWHLWHIARWADRLQAGLSDRSGEMDRSGAMANERWVRENLAAEWHLDPFTLAVFEAGSEMKAEFTHLVAQIGKKRLLGYASSAFADFNKRIEKISDEELTLKLRTAANVDYEAGIPGTLMVMAPTNTQILDELLFHEGHAARHLGMIEALRG